MRGVHNAEAQEDWKLSRFANRPLKFGNHSPVMLSSGGLMYTGYSPYCWFARRILERSAS